ncbi:Amidohydrolase family [Trifolium repens]|jgi:hypothetical protein|nr:Amidohydrolase family [Trifolium repens]
MLAMYMLQASLYDILCIQVIFIAHKFIGSFFLLFMLVFLDSRVHPDRYTIFAGRASFIDNDLGSLSIGKLADFVILSTDSWKDFTETTSNSS